MKNNCAKACCEKKEASGGSTGGSTGNSCASKTNTSKYNKSCDGWARAGYCKKSYVAFMRGNCKKSCCDKGGVKF